MTDDVVERVKENPGLIFQEDGVNINDVIKAIRAHEKKHTLNLATEKGRKEIKSRAAEVSRLKVAIDNRGKQMTEDWRKKTQEVNTTRNTVTSALDDLRDEIRKPVDDWTAQEEARVAAHRATMERITELSHVHPDDSSAMIEDRIEKVREIDTSELGMQEFAEIAKQRADTVITSLTDILSRVRIAEAQAAELAELRRRDQEREAEAAKLREEQEAREAEAQREKEAAEQKARDAQIAQQAAEEALEREAIRRAEEDKRRADEAAAEKARQEEEEARRVADEQHRARIQDEIAKALVSGSSLLPPQAREVIRMIEKETVPHLLITY